MRRIQRFRSGQRVANLRQPLNRLVDALNVDDTPTTNRAPLVIPQQVIVVEIKLLNLDSLACVDVGEGLNPAGRSYLVDLPFTFHPATRDGVSYVYADINNRTADGTEVQQLTPQYMVLDQIWVAWIPGGDGSYIDLNVDGRQWAKVP